MKKELEALKAAASAIQYDREKVNAEGSAKNVSSERREKAKKQEQLDAELARTLEREQAVAQQARARERRRNASREAPREAHKDPPGSNVRGGGITALELAAAERRLTASMTDAVGQLNATMTCMTEILKEVVASSSKSPTRSVVRRESADKGSRESADKGRRRSLDDNRARSPARHRSRSPVRHRSRSPVRRRSPSRSPVRRHSVSPRRRRSPGRTRSRSPDTRSRKRRRDYER